MYTFKTMLITDTVDNQFKTVLKYHLIMNSCRPQIGSHLNHCCRQRLERRHDKLIVIVIDTHFTNILYTHFSRNNHVNTVRVASREFVHLQQLYIVVACKNSAHSDILYAGVTFFSLVFTPGNMIIQLALCEYIRNECN